MSLDLPLPIQRYFSADGSGSTDDLVACFTADATVLDEHRCFKGHGPIHEWHAAAKRKYGHAIEPLEMHAHGDKLMVKGRVSGNFPGSPAVIPFSFALEGGKIASLEIG